MSHITNHIKLKYFLTCIGLFLLIVLTLENVTAQQVKPMLVSGVVTDVVGNGPLPGVNITIKGTQTGTITNVDGAYSLTVNPGDVLVFSFIGYKTVEVETGTLTTINVQLEESSGDIEEIVVIGYGSTLKKEVSGSISTLKTKDFNKGVYNDAMGLIQGKVAGLLITKPNGADPQSGYNIILRGTNTLTSGQGPLLIIDGVAGAELKNINPEDIQSYDVLKDGSAAAIYGTRGTNGVIIITTKRAKPGNSSIEYTSNISVQVAPRGVRTLTADEFKYAIETYAPDKAGSIYGSNTDWFSEITRKMPVSQKHSLALSGGTETFSHRTTFNVEQNTGLLKDNESNKYLFKTNIRQKSLGDHLELDFNLILGVRRYKPANYDLFYQAFIQNPTQPVYDPSNTLYGGYSRLTGIEYYNPVAMLKERERFGKTNDVTPNVRATLNLFEGLNWVNFVSYEGSNYEETSYRTRYYPSRIGSDGEAEISNGGSYSLQYESTVNYAHSFNKHNFQAVVGYSYQEFGFNSSYIGNSGFDSDYFGVNNIGAGSSLQEGTASMSSAKESNLLIAFFGRLIYNFNEKYIANLSLRREGSSRFGANNKWGYFPSLSLAWRVNKEDFMQNVDWVNDLKLRVGYGVTGNQDFDNYKSLILMGRAGKFYYNGEWINSYQPVSNPNPNLKWEMKQEYNAGVDFSLFGNRLGGALEYYYRKSTDLLYTYTVSVPPYLNDQLFTNVGTIRNQGIELTVNAVAYKAHDLEWTTILTFSRNVNKLVKFSNSEFTNKYIEVGWIGGALPQNSQRIEEGRSLGNFYGMVWTGVDQNGLDTYGNLNPIGFPVPKVMGNAYPLFTVGWSNSIIYKDWNLNMSFRSNVGGKVLNLYRAYYENWQTIGTRNIVHTQLEHPEFVGNATYSSKYVEDATFLKLDNISLSYKLKIKSKYISLINLSFTAQDVFCLTKYKGLDPEVNLSGLEPGIERLSYYPRTTTLTFGINATF
jgi:TonB-linked SusC/RagA family outer membrane protein